MEENLVAKMLLNLMPYILLDVFLFVVTLYFLIRKRVPASIILFVASCLSLLSILLRIRYMLALFAPASDYPSPDRFESLRVLVQFADYLSTAGMLGLIVGLLILILQYLKLQAPAKPFGN